MEYNVVSKKTALCVHLSGDLVLLAVDVLSETVVVCEYLYVSNAINGVNCKLTYHIELFTYLSTQLTGA